jgi:hypothetical protein
MSATTFPYGYNSERLTLEQIRARPMCSRIDAEMWRRLSAMIEAAKVAGVDLGIGGAWRSASSQRGLFLDRHTVVSTGGCCGFEGKRYALKPGAAHAAPPGRSYHEESTPAGHCLAVDMLSSDGHRWMNANCETFGLKHFATVNREPWHVQPVEVPTSRTSYRPTLHHPLPVFALPAPPAPPQAEHPLVAVARAIAAARTQVLRVGAKGDAVFWMQTLLTQRGFAAVADGDFGLKTEVALKSFQKSRRLLADGVCGAKTWAALVG